MKEPAFIKIDTQLLEGINSLIDRRHEDGETYEEICADFWNSYCPAEFGPDVDIDSLPFQRALAANFLIAVAIADEHMKKQGWEYDQETDRWKAPELPKED